MAVSAAETARHAPPGAPARCGCCEDEAVLAELARRPSRRRSSAPAPIAPQRAQGAGAGQAAARVSRIVPGAAGSRAEQPQRRRGCGRRAHSVRRGACAAAQAFNEIGMRMPQDEELLIGLVSVSDRASQGVYQDEGIPALQRVVRRARLPRPWRVEERLIADEQPAIERTLIELLRPGRLPPGADHRRHRPGAARRHARGHAGRGATR